MEAEQDQPWQQQQPQELNIITLLQQFRQEMADQHRDLVQLLQPLQGPPPPPQEQGPQPLQGLPPYFVTPPPQEQGWANSPVAMVIIYNNGYSEYIDMEMARAAPVNLGAASPNRIRRRGPPCPNF